MEDCFKAIQLNHIFSSQSNLLVHALSREISSVRFSCCHVAFYICNKHKLIKSYTNTMGDLKPISHKQFNKCIKDKGFKRKK